MTTRFFISGAVLLLSMCPAVSFFPLSVQAADLLVSAETVHSAHGESAIVTLPVQESDGMAAGAVGDTLKACLKRIPADGTAGQRMLAEQGCQAEHETRMLIQAAPRF
jgi:hypothetical protein